MIHIPCHDSASDYSWSHNCKRKERKIHCITFSFFNLNWPTSSPFTRLSLISVSQCLPDFLSLLHDATGKTHRYLQSCRSPLKECHWYKVAARRGARRDQSRAQCPLLLDGAPLRKKDQSFAQYTPVHASTPTCGQSFEHVHPSTC